MTGCDLYPNGSYIKFYHLAYNAHDFLSFDVDNSCWERQQEGELASQVERQFNNFTGFSATLQHLLNVTCVEYMKKFIKYGRAALERQEPPVATIFTRTPRPDQLLLVCRVTGFYPRSISVAWLRDGQEVPPGPALNTSAILPNADLTYQLRSILAVGPRDGHSYACRVRHRSLGTRSLLIPWGSSKVALIVGITIVVLLAMAAALTGAIRHYKTQRPQILCIPDSKTLGVNLKSPPVVSARGSSDHEVVKFQAVGDRRKTASKTSGLDMERADLALLKELVSKVSWESAFEGIGVHECWSLCCREKIHAAKARLEFKLASTVKDSKKGF
ncbi:T-cell surface glycoprotein CD1b-3-like [Pelecanus crispus]|uniref:T-cell surface glycoprotein CD1b-3-like n=1 Tax=Pelecanus crispus TaxID=36300 RepID=UPI003F5D078A